MTEREQVERTADRIRDELMLTLEELDRRRHAAFDVRHQLEDHRELLIRAGLAAAGVAAVWTGFALYRARHRDRYLAKKRRDALRRAWKHPDRIASQAEVAPLPVELGRKLVLIFGTALATSLAKRSVETLVPPRTRTGPAPAPGTTAATQELRAKQEQQVALAKAAPASLKRH